MGSLIVLSDRHKEARKSHFRYKMAMHGSQSTTFTCSPVHHLHMFTSTKSLLPLILTSKLIRESPSLLWWSTGVLIPCLYVLKLFIARGHPNPYDHDLHSLALMLRRLGHFTFTFQFWGLFHSSFFSSYKGAGCCSGKATTIDPGKS